MCSVNLTFNIPQDSLEFHAPPQVVIPLPQLPSCTIGERNQRQYMHWRSIFDQILDVLNMKTCVIRPEHRRLFSPDLSSGNQGTLRLLVESCFTPELSSKLREMGWKPHHELWQLWGFLLTYFNDLSIIACGYHQQWNGHSSQELQREMDCMCSSDPGSNPRCFPPPNEPELYAQHSSSGQHQYHSSPSDRRSQYYQSHNQPHRRTHEHSHGHSHEHSHRHTHWEASQAEVSNIQPLPHIHQPTVPTRTSSISPTKSDVATPKQTVRRSHTSGRPLMPGEKYRSILGHSQASMSVATSTSSISFAGRPSNAPKQKRKEPTRYSPTITTPTTASTRGKIRAETLEGYYPVGTPSIVRHATTSSNTTTSRSVDMTNIPKRPLPPTPTPTTAGGKEVRTGSRQSSPHTSDSTGALTGRGGWS